MDRPPKPLLGPRPIRLPRMPWLAAGGRMLARQAAIESFGAPGYGMTLAHPRPTGLAASPRDFRPTDRTLARAAISGRFLFVGASLDAPSPKDPWNRPSPSRPFAVELHRYAWLPHLLVLGDPGAREGARLVLAWRRTFGEWSPFAWSREVLSRRVFNLACAIRPLSRAGDEEDEGELIDLLARQARHLLRLPDNPATAAENSAAAAVAGAALAGDAGDKLLKRALPRLSRALNRTVLADGSHASRSPEAGLELLLDLLTLDDALLQRGMEPPAGLQKAIDRLSLALRTFTLGDGRLACFQGGEASSAARVAAARAQDDPEASAPETLTEGGYERLQGQLLQVFVDAGQPAKGPFSVTACAQPLALEIVCGRDRLITNTGWSPREPERQGFRLTPAGSTMTLGEVSVVDPLQGRLGEILGPRLEGPLFRVERRRYEEEGAVLLEVAHDGWVARFGLSHERALWLERTSDELRGEDRLVPQEGSNARALAAPYALRFHLHPQVQVSLARDRKSVLLRGPGGQGWWFRNDAAEVSIEPGAWFENGYSRRASQIVLRGVARTNAQTRVRWKITPAGAGDGA